MTDRYIYTRDLQAPFVREATPFQDFVIRCVRYAFAYISANIARIFFSKRVALPWLRWRMLRHGYLSSPVPWKEVHVDGLEGIWIGDDNVTSCDTDIVIYYVHGESDTTIILLAQKSNYG